MRGRDEMVIDGTRLDPAAALALPVGSILPRPIAWVSTVSADGVANLAPVSFFTGVGRKPPMVALALQPRADGEPVDTFVDIWDSGEFVVNVVTLSLAHQAHRSAREFPHDVDEFPAVGVAKAPCEIRDDLYLGRGRTDTAALAPVGRLAAEYTAVENAFLTPLDDDVLAAWAGRRVRRLDGRPDGFSPLDPPVPGSRP